VAGREVFGRLPLDFYHIFSLGGKRCALVSGVGRGDCRPESRRIRLTEIVERILSASDVGGFPPPIARLYAGGSAQQLREIEVRALTVDRSGSFTRQRMREEQRFDSMRTTGK